MGFIERLRQQKEAEVQQRKAQKEAEETAQTQKFEQEWKLHFQRNLQANQYFKESGTESLISDLDQIIGNLEYYKGLNPARLERRDTLGYVVWNRELPRLARDPDSTSLGILLDDIATGKKGSSGSVLPITSWCEFQAKFFVVESNPDGDIIFYAKKEILILEREWKNNRDVLEHALELSYNEPRIQIIRGDFFTFQGTS